MSTTSEEDRSAFHLLNNSLKVEWLIFDINSLTLLGIFISRSWLKGRIPSRSNISKFTSSGSKVLAARKRALLNDPTLTLPAKPSIF